MQEVIDTIRSMHRERCFAMEQRKRADLALGAYLRTALGWRKDLPDADRKKITYRAAAVQGGSYDDETEVFRAVVEASIAARLPFDRIEANASKSIEKLARALPVWVSFGEGIRGFGAGSLGVVVAEAGDLGNYPDHSKLWKRMGLAVIDGIRQGGLPKSAHKDDWIEHAYNRQRRSRMWNIGDALIKGNRDGKYRTLYLARKQYETERDPEMKPIVAHRRAQRVMEKRLLRDLWQAWRRADGLLPNGPMGWVPSSQSISSDGNVRGRRRAIILMPDLTAKTPVPSANHSEA